MGAGAEKIKLLDEELVRQKVKRHEQVRLNSTDSSRP